MFLATTQVFLGRILLSLLGPAMKCLGYISSIAIFFKYSSSLIRTHIVTNTNKNGWLVKITSHKFTRLLVSNGKWRNIPTNGQNLCSSKIFPQINYATLKVMNLLTASSQQTFTSTTYTIAILLTLLEQVDDKIAVPLIVTLEQSTCQWHEDTSLYSATYCGLGSLE